MPGSLAFRTVAVLALVAFLAGCLAAAAPAQEPVAPATRTVVAVGTGDAAVTPKDRNSNASIKAAVEVAQAKALPIAVAEAREYATRLAAAVGVTLGPLLSISNTSPSPFSSYGFNGTFGPDRYCGTVRQVVHKRGKDGKLHRAGTRTRRVCRVPPRVTQSVQLTYAQA